MRGVWPEGVALFKVLYCENPVSCKASILMNVGYLGVSSSVALVLAECQKPFSCPPAGLGDSVAAYAIACCCSWRAAPGRQSRRFRPPGQARAARRWDRWLRRRLISSERAHHLCGGSTTGCGPLYTQTKSLQPGTGTV